MVYPWNAPGNVHSHSLNFLNMANIICLHHFKNTLQKPLPYMHAGYILFSGIIHRIFPHITYKIENNKLTVRKL